LKEKVYIIIVTYNGEEWISKCLESYSSFPIVVIDNNSTDKTLSIIKDNFSEVTILAQNINLGFGGANNIGMKFAIEQGADYVFLSNQDVYQAPHAVERLVEVHKNNLDFGVVSPIHMNGDGDKLDKNFSNYINYNGNPYLYLDALKGETKDVYEVPFVNAAAWLIPVTTLGEIGGFDPLFFHYGEDINYCQRLIFHKFKIGIVMESYIYHDRENINKRPEFTFEDKLNRMTRHYKIKWANINKNVDGIIFDRKKYIIIKMIKCFIFFKFKNSYKYYLEYIVIRSIKGEIANSRSLNILLGNHYLIDQNE
jgi:GT2 family glycosyltransferase